MARRSRASRVVSVSCLAVAVAAGLTVMQASSGAAFVGLRGSARTMGAVTRFAEGGAAPGGAAPKASTALVKVDEDNVKTTAGVLAGLAGLLTGGLWLGAGLFAATSYLARKDDDLGTAIRGVSKTTLEALNFTADIDSKYQVTDNISKSVSGAVEKNVKSSDKANIDGALGAVSSSYDSLDKEVGIKDTLGNIALTASSLASEAVEKLLEFNEKNKVTDKIASQVSDLASKATEKTAEKK